MASKVIFGALAVIPGALAFGSALKLATPANAFEVERTRGSNQASRIVRTTKVQASVPKVKAESQAKVRRSPIFVRGNHGAQKIITQEGVGGPTREYKGFPKLEQRGSHGALRIVND